MSNAAGPAAFRSAHLPHAEHKFAQLAADLGLLTVTSQHPAAATRLKDRHGFRTQLVTRRNVFIAAKREHP